MPRAKKILESPPEEIVAPQPPLSSPFSKLSAVTANQIMYLALLVSFLLNGYFFARVQASGQSVFPGGVVAGTTTTQTGDATTPPAEPAARENVQVDTGSLPVLGQEDAPVTIVEFSDFQCPFCRRFYTDAYQQLKKEYIDTGKVKLYFRHYPLDFHPMAVPSALAAECANDQDKFWEMHDKLYDEQEKKGSGTTIEYTNDDIKAWATDLGLEMTSFNTCFDSKKYEDRVTKDTADGSAAGVSGTPAFFIEGTELIGAQPFEAFKTIIDKKLAE